MATVFHCVWSQRGIASDCSSSKKLGQFISLEISKCLILDILQSLDEAFSFLESKIYNIFSNDYVSGNKILLSFDIALVT